MKKDVYSIIKRPLFSEKNSRLKAKYNKYVFEVDRNANKIEIKKALEEIFAVKVLKVNTINVLGKVRRRGRTSGKRPDWKKAIATLREGDKIPILE
ncbi:MAG TPA: 50S ribosomal protein L23 [Candidatus Limnocylindrales bacterium]|nr:50S ribosomal protein L23 [Candidatus Limnocylindrales bacterium]